MDKVLLGLICVIVGLLILLVALVPYRGAKRSASTIIFGAILLLGGFVVIFSPT